LGTPSPIAKAAIKSRSSVPRMRASQRSSATNRRSDTPSTLWLVASVSLRETQALWSPRGQTANHGLGGDSRWRGRGRAEPRAGATRRQQQASQWENNKRGVLLGSNAASFPFGKPKPFGTGPVSTHQNEAASPCNHRRDGNTTMLSPTMVLCPQRGNHKEDETKSCGSCGRNPIIYPSLSFLPFPLIFFT